MIFLNSWEFVKPEWWKHTREEDEYVFRENTDVIKLSWKLLLIHQFHLLVEASKPDNELKSRIILVLRVKYTEGAQYRDSRANQQPSFYQRF